MRVSSCEDIIFMVFFQLHLGPLAHLVERFHGMEEVTGSIPVRSTKFDLTKNAIRARGRIKNKTSFV